MSWFGEQLVRISLTISGVFLWLMITILTNRANATVGLSVTIASHMLYIQSWLYQLWL